MAYDGPALFLVPSSNEAAKSNFQRTVVEGIATERLREYTDRTFDGETVPVWGTKQGNESTWTQLEPGDFLLFYQDQHYPYAAEVSGTEQNEALGRDLWPNHEEDDPWEYIIYLGEVTEPEIGRGEVNDLAGYSENFAPMGFQTVRDFGVGGVRGRYGSIEAFVQGQKASRAQEDSVPPIDAQADPTVDIPEDVLEGLYFPDGLATEIVTQITAALNAGKHIIFTGPPGTGKTEIARRVSRHLAEQHPNVYSGFRTTTATADWSTFETVGGYMPEESSADGDDLSFEPGQILRRFKRDGRQQNELLIIDEINRADIDKAFGQLFTLLSGQAVQLPYKHDGEEIEIHPASELDGPPAEHQYVMPSSWRILATMNSYDKTSLYEMSYAFMRRFAFVHVDAPDIPSNEEARNALVRSYANAWELNPSEETVRGVGDIWRATNGGESERKLGPALLKDMMAHVQHTESDTSTALTQAVTDYVFPQLEGVRGRKRIVNRIAAVDAIDERRLARLAEDVLRVTPDE